MLISWGKKEGTNLSPTGWRGLWERSRIRSSRETLPIELRTRKCLPTFEEDKFAILPLIGSVDGGRQAPPELANGHWVSVHHLVIPHPPEPSLLETRKGEGEHIMSYTLVFLIPQSSPYCPRFCGFSFRLFPSIFLAVNPSVPSNNPTSSLPLTLKTNISPRSMATVSKFPSQMLGP